MKNDAHMRSIMVAVILVGALAFTLIAVGCFGGGEDATSTTAAGADTAVTTSLAGGTTATANVDPLSSFNSKDPFIPQAQATTTIAPATTASTILTTTTRVVTTTIPHRLTVTAFPGGGFVAFTIDGDSFTSFQAGPALLAGAWGTIQILAVNDGAAPFSATFRRNGTIDFTLQLGASRTW